MQQDIAQPAAVLHVDRLVQSQHPLERCTVHLPQAAQSALHDVDDIARDEADREKDQDAENEQSRNDQQQPPDDVGSHVLPLTRKWWQTGDACRSVFIVSVSRSDRAAHRDLPVIEHSEGGQFRCPPPAGQ